MTPVRLIKNILLTLLSMVSILVIISLTGSSQWLPFSTTGLAASQQLAEPLVTGVPVVSIGSGDVGPGMEITVPLMASLGNESLGAATVDIQYDSTVLTATVCDGDPDGDLDLAQCSVDFTDNTVRLTALSAAGVSGDILFANITFQAIGSDGDSSLLDVSIDTFADPSGDPITANDADGLITIEGATPTVTNTPISTPPNTPTSTPTPSGGAIVQVGSGDVAPGGSLIVSLEAFGISAETLGGAGLGAATIDVQYDPSVVEATVCDPDPNDDFTTALCETDFAADTVRFTAISTDGVSGNLLLADITFQAVGSLNESSPLNVMIDTFTDPSGNPISATDQDGLISILDVTPTNTPVGSTPTNSPTPSPTPEGGTVVRMGSGDVAPGDSITVPLEALGISAATLEGAGLGAATIDVQYDPSVVEATACDPDPNGDFSTALCETDFAADTVRFTAISTDGVSGNILLADITFQAVGSLNESSPLDVMIDTFTDPSGNPISATDQDGQIIIIDIAVTVTPTGTNIPSTPTVTNTPVSSPTMTNTPVGSPTMTNTPVSSPTMTNTPVSSPTMTNTPTGSPTMTNTPVPPTVTNTPTPVIFNLVCNGAAATFEDGIPSNWDTEVNEGPVYWSTTADTAACDNGMNHTPGSNFAACADSDETNGFGEDYDTEMWTPAFDLTDVPTATLQFAAGYRDINPSGGDRFEVDIWDGSTFHSALNWHEDHRNPGELVELDLNDYVGQSDIQVRFRYSGVGWDWWVHVDDVALDCGELTAEPSIQLEKTVGTDPDVCATSDTLILPTGGGMVTYCYKVTNTSNVTFNLHDLVDDQLGSLLANHPHTLLPAASYTVLETEMVTEDTINTATWTASSGSLTASASDSAEVRIEPLCGATILSRGDGDWTDASTWDANRVPNGSDIVLIQDGHMVTGAVDTNIEAFCNYGTLQSQANQSLTLKANRAFENYGEILGQDGQAGSGSICGTLGSSLRLHGHPFVNEGTIKAGDGGNGEYCGGPGGTTRIMGRKTTNTDTGVISAGKGGNVSSAGLRTALDHPRELAGTYVGGRGGDTHVRGNTGGSGYVHNQGTLQAGDGGDGHPSATISQSGGNGGCLYIIASSLALNGNQWAGLGGQGTGGGPDGMDGCVSIDPIVINLSGTNTSIRGGNIDIFGGDDWVLDLSDMADGAIDASGDLTLAVGEGGSIDFTGNNSNIIQADGNVTIASDDVQIDEGTSLEDVIEAEEIMEEESQLVVEFALASAGSLSMQPGDKQSYEVTVLNNGPMTDSYTLEWTDSDGWLQGSLPTSASVAGLEHEDLSVMLVTPDGLTNGSTSTVTVNAVSQTDPSEVRTLVFEVTFDDGMIRIHLPIITR